MLGGGEGDQPKTEATFQTGGGGGLRRRGGAELDEERAPLASVGAAV